MAQRQPKPAKQWYLSKTLWANVLVLAVMVIGYLAYQPIIPPEWSSLLVVIMGVLNIILRFLTDGPITTRPATKPDYSPHIEAEYYTQGNEPPVKK